MDTEILRKKYTLWSNIVDLRSRGINITRTAERLGVSRDTVKRLQSLSSDELFRKYQESRRCKLQNYEQAVVSLLFTFPSTSSSRVHDYLKEHYPDFPNVCDKSVHNYVQFIRKKHHLPFRSCRLWRNPNLRVQIFNIANIISWSEIKDKYGLDGNPKEY